MPDDPTSRFARCRCVRVARLEGAAPGAPPVPLPYRCCPVGVIAELDCPEFVGARCAYFDDRGDAAVAEVPAAEAAHLAAELARDFLTPRYRRRVAALRGSGAAPSPLEPLPAAATTVPVNVPADGDAPRRGAPTHVGGEGESRSHVATDRSQPDVAPTDHRPPANR